jgi:terminal uridylyltransferase
MDLALLSPFSRVQPDEKGSPIPRLIEKALLDAGIGARLLTRTRVPIIKLCEHPPEALYGDLLVQREKWEKGLDNENQEDQVDEEQDQDENAAAANEKDDDHQTEPPPAQGGSKAMEVTEFEVPSGDGEPQRFYLKQAPGTSLDSYYGTAKKVLRKAGGRDVRTPTMNTFTDEEWDILYRVCQAFVRGLADPLLRQRLERYPSLSFQPAPGMPDRHSLTTTFTQIEGEHAVQKWAAWLAREGVDPDPNTEQAVMAWIQAQGRQNYGVDPVAYNKELQLLLDRMKKFASIQLVLLEQDHDESPTQYHLRATRIMEGLGSNRYGPAGGLEKSIIEQYVAGIHPKEIKSAVVEYVDSMTGPITLDTVARRHKSFQLAREFSRALEKKSYDAQHVEDVEAYVNLLKSPLRKSTKGHVRYDFVVPVSKKTAALVAKIKALDDPHQLAPNQPRAKYKDHLEFPKSGAGVQCDINFSAHLALENTLLLRCYSHTDPRVRPMVLFVKHWAKMRGINSGYRGTLSSYGYVMMVLHYLVNVAQPFVCPNLQQLAPAPPPHLSPLDVENSNRFRGYNVQFWRNEQEILHLASMHQLNHNQESIGHLLRGFFEYFAQSGPMSAGNGKGFDWGRDVLSLRTQGGLLSKQAKGWTGAKTVYEVQGGQSSQGPKAAAAPGSNPNVPASDSLAKPKGDDVKEVRLRYLFAIEDPFETDHNIARTVTHNGIVSIRDEFRRAWRIIKAAGSGDVSEQLLQEVSEEKKDDKTSFADLLHEIHGPVIFDDDDDGNVE